ncbi:hypothetical protein [Streptomyces longispororuber]|uniref:hypothetical protein n=1 Tax=Streptomyces longispororuber TaxID=68230 RepID=UPI00210B7595|nr:hypothetical protein [Streptomyces longispororuber]MCQ4213914.1 hypothetical protein [Streptomyces longispororuber]
MRRAEPGGGARRGLLDALALVAADAATQRAWVERHRVGPDEIALLHDDHLHARLLDRLVAEGEVSARTLPVLRELDGVFAAMTAADDPARWSTGALADDPGWARARTLARRALAMEDRASDSPGDRATG